MSDSNSLLNTKGFVDTETPFGFYLSGKYMRSFAYITMKDRLPVIITRIIDNISRSKVVHSEDAMQELKQIIGSLSRLKSEIVTNKILQPMVSSNSDIDSDIRIWNQQINEQTVVDKSPPTWFHTRWLLAECYMYRRIAHMLSSTINLTTLDLFKSQKDSSFTKSIDFIKPIAKHIMGLLKTDKNYSLSEQNHHFETFLKLSLWANRYDLSLSGGVATNINENPMNQLTSFEEDLLINDSQSIWQLLEKSKNTDVIIDIILDNAGYELYADLCLAAFLTSQNLAKKVRFYVKRIPWFVSDVTEQDFYWLINFMYNSTNPDMKSFSEMCSNYLKHGKWTVEIESFWTEPFDFSEMESKASGLYTKLSNATLVIFKGDLNYRKLLGDIRWEYSTNFITCLRKFKPTSIVSLRTLKADLVVGLTNEKVCKLQAQNEQWMTIGKYGTIHAAIQMEA